MAADAEEQLEADEADAGADAAADDDAEDRADEAEAGEADEADEADTSEAGGADSGDSDLSSDDDAEAGPLSEEEKQTRLKSIVESLLFAADRPLPLQRLRELTRERATTRLEIVLGQLEQDYQTRGIVLHNVAGGYQLRTHPDNSRWVQALVAGRPVRLSRAQLEVLAIAAYRQPLTRAEIEEIRGVDCGSPIRVLLDRNLIRILGKKEEPGRPLLYGTTKEFLQFFNLNDLRELPTLREFSELTADSQRQVDELEAEGDDGDELADDGDLTGDDEGAADVARAEGAADATDAADAAGDADADADADLDADAGDADGDADADADLDADDREE